tara:strand:- start:48 stop:878 length:831 start_codon:yes stop_codon:yes gene_type:complete
MTKRISRECRIDTRIDTDTGEFDLVLATEGEASDGHVISIRGLDFADTIPLQMDHSRSVLANLGTVSHMRRDRVDGIAALRGVGQIRLTGDGEGLEARRDLVDAISSGHVRGTSLTWDSIKQVERRELPKGHAANVTTSEQSVRKKYGIFFEQSRAVEQSIVGIPADREALIGRSGSATSEISRSMWDGMIERIHDPATVRTSEIISALEQTVEQLEATSREAGEDPSDETPDESLSVTQALEETITRIERGGRATSADLREGLDDVFERLTGSRI